MNTQRLPPRPPEPIQRPFRLINDPDLCYELGGNFNQFLKRYEQAASFFGCSEYKMAMQIGRFMKTEDLLTALEYMDGYDKADWKQLRAEMIELWGEFEKPLLLYTTQDLLKLKEEVVSQGGITNYQEFKDYLAEFSEILDYLPVNQVAERVADASWRHKDFVDGKSSRPRGGTPSRTWTRKRGVRRSKRLPPSTQSTRTNQGLASKKAQSPPRSKDPRHS
ncbi:hypothetical protein PCANC_06430 [Puccinia coronata f. sp. avenae]|uniref:Uncharacterized protein n=1 Tax=Puccinia coronata f. sp. avenae TaxID=200324 RepID=A0A2N5VVR5_9BASI|nr:hypothetical protein PCANC_06430 [Puccinia coronata f. sp. avenae]